MSVTLEDQAATLAAYLNDYIRKEQRDRSEYAFKYLSYVLSLCWRKLYKRILTDPGLAFAFGLKDWWPMWEKCIGHINWDMEPKVRGPGDHTLASFIKHGRNVMSKMNSEEIDFLDEHKGFKKLYRQIDDPNGPLHSDGPLYTKDMVESFHRLIFSALVLFGSSLSRVDACFSKSKQLNSPFTFKDVQERLLVVRGYTHLLSAVLCSSAFKQHITLITGDIGPQVLKANWTHRLSYRDFGRTYRIRTGGLSDPDPQDKSQYDEYYESQYDYDKEAMSQSIVCLINAQRRALT